MPALGSRAEHERVGADRFADQPPLDYVATGLESDAEERVGRATEAEVETGRPGDEIATFFEVDAEWLLAERGLARFERRSRHRRVHQRGSEVDDRVDVGIGKHLVEREHARDLVLGGKRRRALGKRVGTCDDVDETELAQRVRVLGTDDPAPHDRDRVHLRPRESWLSTR